jgi:hypothetical protein
MLTELVTGAQQVALPQPVGPGVVGAAQRPGLAGRAGLGTARLRGRHGTTWEPRWRQTLSWARSSPALIRTSRTLSPATSTTWSDPSRSTWSARPAQDHSRYSSRSRSRSKPSSLR